MSIDPAILGFKARLRQAMAYAGIETPTALAKELKTSQSTARQWCDDSREDVPKGPMLMKLAPVLRVSLHWLLTNQGPINPPTNDETAIHESGRRLGRIEAVEGLRQLQAELVDPRGAIALPADDEQKRAWLEAMLESLKGPTQKGA